MHVVAGLIHDQSHRLLLQQRTEPPHFAGLWEFPGGKIEANESAPLALKRELEEELGLYEVESVAWMRLLHDYSLNELQRRRDQPKDLPRILLDIRHVRHYTGQPRSREGQHFEWVTVDRLGELDCLDANRPIVTALQRAEAIRLRRQG